MAADDKPAKAAKPDKAAADKPAKSAKPGGQDKAAERCGRQRARAATAKAARKGEKAAAPQRPGRRTTGRA